MLCNHGGVVTESLLLSATEEAVNTIQGVMPLVLSQGPQLGM